MSKGTIVVFLFAFVASVPYAKAQANDEVKKNEVGLVIGATIRPSDPLEPVQPAQ